jgi:ATP-dependent RNA helicase SUPV3L1/SUV3
MPELPPESAVHLKAWNFANASEARNAGYRRIGDEYVRIDLAERVIKKAHEARGQGNLFGMDMAFATSLGISEAGLKALMRDAGFRPAEKAPEPEVVTETVPDAVVEAIEVVAEDIARTHEPEELEMAVPAAPEVSAHEAAAPQAAEPQASILTHWRWVGLPKPRPPEQRQPRAKPQHQKSQTTGKPPAKPERAPVAAKQTAQPSSLALQLAALKGLKL